MRSASLPYLLASINVNNTMALVYTTCIKQKVLWSCVNQIINNSKIVNKASSEYKIIYPI